MWLAWQRGWPVQHRTSVLMGAIILGTPLHLQGSWCSRCTRMSGRIMVAGVQAQTSLVCVVECDDL